ncbi:hypothetical protein DN069_17525 [Streptacidiphilus pinicola]|uniref:Uncharacterized protein n=1 Tax=Streptacidiphilus pinicola TaxID=2219663 RepID=A0A2X0KA61_9ACTN|nr:hypothetical protein DN069_17525 [Streptacidiphilus pinicola]
MTFVNFRDHPFADGRAHGFRWVDLKSFRFPQGSRDSDLLAAVVAHAQFRDDYAGGGVDPGGTRHGPYWLRTVSPHDYQPVARAEAAQVLKEWANQQGGLPGSLEDALEATLFAVVNSASRLYRLRDLGRDAFHDWGGVHIDFHEFVAIDHDRQVLTLLVAADD